MNKKTDKKNRILLLLLILITLISTAGAVVWFSMYAPLVLTNH